MAGPENEKNRTTRAGDAGRANGGAGAGDLAAERKGARQTGRYAYDGLQRVIHERSRLGILSSLAAHPDGLLFTDLKGLCNLTDGNLSRQLQLLQETGFVQVLKGFKNNRPQTLCQLTEAGRERFLEYIAVLENVVADAMAAPRPAAGAVPRVSPA